MAKSRAIVRYRSRPKAKRRAHRQGFTLPVAAVAGFLPLAGAMATSYKQGGIDLMGNNLVSNLTGYDPKSKTWAFSHMQNGLVPIVAGIMAHKIIGGKLGVNRMLAQAGVPFVRI